MDAAGKSPQNGGNNRGSGKQQWLQRHTMPQAKRASHKSPALGVPGMQAVFLASGGSSTGRTSHGGTGFFLPRRPGTTFHLHHRPACSTILLPSRVVHALNRGVQTFSNGVDLQEATKKSVDREWTSSYIIDGQRNVINKRNVDINGAESRLPPCSPCPEAVCLPNEWTY